MSEEKEIFSRYEKRKYSGRVLKNQKNISYGYYISKEREKIYRSVIFENFENIGDLRLLEIGAGSGYNIRFFKELGIKEENIAANELLPDRVEELKNNFPLVKVYPGNILDVSVPEKADVVFQSTVFSSVLDDKFRKKIAQKMMQLVSEKGIILWYDFTFNNPNNPDVRKVTRSEVKELFPGKEITFRKVTLAPPIGRKVGMLYPILNFLFPFLRTHIIAVIK